MRAWIKPAVRQRLARQIDGSVQQVEGEVFPHACVGGRHARSGGQTQGGVDRRDAVAVESRITAEGAFRKLGREVEGHAAVTAAVLVSAFETGIAVGEQQRTRHQRLAPVLRSVMEAARHHHGHAGPGVLLLEPGRIGPGAANQLAHSPAIAGGDRSRVHQGIDGGRVSDGNFPQDAAGGSARF